MTAPEVNVPRQASRWETLVWPRWLPVRARMPLVAQVTGAVALTSLLVGPWWASAPESIPQPRIIPVERVAPLAPTVAPVPAAVPRKPAAPVSGQPAHLNLDVRHSFGSVDLSVTVDGKPALQTKLAGSGKRFKVFGKRSERGFTRTLDLSPGVHLVRVRVLSAADKFDQTRVERFDLGPASVASMRISADSTGLTLVAERPPAPPPVPAPAPEAVAAAPAPVDPAPAPVQAAPPAATPPSAPLSRQDANAVVDLLQSVRSMLIAIAGFVASAATGFVVQEYLRSRRGMIFAHEAAQAGAPAPAQGERRRRRRSAKPRSAEPPADPVDPEPSS